MVVDSDKELELLSRLEILLLTPKSNDETLLEEFPEYKSELENVLKFVKYIKDVDVYRGIKFLDKIFGQSILLSNVKLMDYNHLYNHLSEACYNVLCNDDGILNQFYILCGMVLMINIFIRVNWLGPPVSVVLESDKHLSDKYNNSIIIDDIDLDNIDSLDNPTLKAYANDKISKEINDKCILKSPDLKYIDLLHKNNDEQIINLLKSIIDDLSIDGEYIYIGTCGLLYFYSALVILSILNNQNKFHHQFKLSSIQIWQSRIAFIWQKIINNSIHSPCPTLYQISTIHFISTLKTLKVSL